MDGAVSLARLARGSGAEARAVALSVLAHERAVQVGTEAAWDRPGVEGEEAAAREQATTLLRAQGTTEGALAHDVASVGAEDLPRASRHRHGKHEQPVHLDFFRGVSSSSGLHRPATVYRWSMATFRLPTPSMT